MPDGMTLHLISTYIPPASPSIQQELITYIKELKDTHPPGKNHYIFAGDFNTPMKTIQSTNPALAVFLEDQKLIPINANEHGPQELTHHPHATGQRSSMIDDFLISEGLLIATKTHFKDIKCEILGNNSYMSDHLPLSITFPSKMTPIIQGRQHLGRPTSEELHENLNHPTCNKEIKRPISKVNMETSRAQILTETSTECNALKMSTASQLVKIQEK